MISISLMLWSGDITQEEKVQFNTEVEVISTASIVQSYQHGIIILPIHGKLGLRLGLGGRTGVFHVNTHIHIHLICVC